MRELKSTSFFRVEKVLAVLLIETEKLTAHRSKKLFQHGFDERAEKPGILLGNRQHEAKIVSELLGRCADRRIDVGRRQAMDRQRVNDADSGRFVLRARERLLDARIEHTAAIDDLLYGGVRSERRIVTEHTPIGIVGDQAGVIRRNVLIDDAPDCSAERLQHLALLGDVNALKRVEIGRVNREQADKLVHPLIHRAVERRELLQMLPDQSLLFGVLLQEALGNDESDVIPSYMNLLEAILHAPKRVSHELEPGIVKQALLETGNEAKP